jgi:hypothetical protein
MIAVDPLIGGPVDIGFQVAHAEAVDRIAELDLGLDLVALGHGHLAHVVAEAGDLQTARFVPSEGGACPDRQLLAHIRLLPVADDHGASLAAGGCR